MSTVFNEGRRPAEFLLSEGNGQISRDSAVITAGSGVIAPGAVLAKVTETGKYVPAVDTGSDGSQTAVAIAIYGCDATSADQKTAIVARDVEVKLDGLVFNSSVNDAAKKAAQIAQLAALGIIVRS